MTSGVVPSRRGDETLPRESRITKSEEIRAVFRRGKRRKTRHLDVFVSASPVAHSRIGLVVAKPRRRKSSGRTRIRGAAVARNRLKRRLREIARTELLPGLAAAGKRVDVLVRTRPEAYGAAYAALKAELKDVEVWLCSGES